MATQKKKKRLKSKNDEAYPFYTEMKVVIKSFLWRIFHDFIVVGLSSLTNKVRLLTIKFQFHLSVVQKKKKKPQESSKKQINITMACSLTRS